MGDGRQHDQKVSLRSLKNHPAMNVFRDLDRALGPSEYRLVGVVLDWLEEQAGVRRRTYADPWPRP